MIAEPHSWEALIVGCGGRRLALRLRDVVEVCRALPISPMPGVPAPVVGLTVLRGRPVPVVDLTKLIEADGCEPELFVSVRTGARVVALAVGCVIGIRELPERLDELPPLVGDSRGAGIVAVTRLDGELVEVLRHGRLVPAATWEMLSGSTS